VKAKYNIFECCPTDDNEVRFKKYDGHFLFPLYLADDKVINLTN